MQERHPHPEDALIRYQATREQVARDFPIPPERLDIMRTEPGRTKEVLLEFVREKPGAIVVALTKLRDRLLREEGRIYSQPALCAQYIIEELGRPIIEKSSMQALMNKRIEEYVFTYDVAFGMVQTAMRVEIAERSIVEDMDADLEDALLQLKQEGLDVPEEQIRNVIESLKQENQEASSLLRKDKSEIPGGALLEDFVEKLRRDETTVVYPVQIREFLVYGGETALEFYKAIYPLSTSMPSP